MTTIGIIGQGFVGSAIAKAFSTVDSIKIKTFDKNQKIQQTCKSIDEFFTHDGEHCEFVFICVPTPMNDDGTCDTFIVEKVIKLIDQKIHQQTTLIIKSTIPPGTTDKFQNDYENIKIVFNPEFLNARSAYEDFMSQDHVVLGGNADACYHVKTLFKKLLPNAEYCICDAKTAETVKYVKNAFFATKVSFANEMYQICQKLGIDYDHMISIAKHDDRMGWEHWKVPGPTLGEGPYAGQQMFGFGGPCLPKDIQAFQQLAIKLGVVPNVMRAAWEKNLEVRSECDWKYISSAVKNVKS